MPPAWYTILRYVPEPARNEPVNIGVAAWASGRHVIKLDRAAFGRVLAGNPDLDKRAFDDFAEYLLEQLSTGWPESDHLAHDFIMETIGFPMSATDSLPVRIDVAAADEVRLDEALDRCADRMFTRLVKLRFRQSQIRRSSPHAILKRRLAPWIAANQVAENYSVRDTNSGIERKVSFYANSGANVALKLVTFPLTPDPRPLRV